jgi:hypothetical protein
VGALWNGVPDGRGRSGIRSEIFSAIIMIAALISAVTMRVAKTSEASLADRFGPPCLVRRQRRLYALDAFRLRRHRGSADDCRLHFCGR